MANRTRTVMQCPETLSREYLGYVGRLGKALATAKWRPEPSKVMVKRWDDYVRDWSTNKRRPLFIRRRTAGRGSVIQHESGRQLVPVDNSTAHWVYRAVLANRAPPKRLYIQSIPVAMALTKDERRKATYNNIDSKVRLGVDLHRNLTQ